MKKEAVFVILSLILLAVIVSAVANQSQVQVQTQTQNQVSNSGTVSQIREQLQEKKQEIKDDIKELREVRKELKGDIKAYLQERKEIRAEIRGINITLEKGEQNQIKLRVRNQTARTTLDIIETIDENNNTILKIKSSNGNEIEIKIMPDTAAERAIERLKLKVCNESNNCTIELKDVPVKKANKLAYEIQVQRHYKLLALFKAKAINKAQIDAETGKILVVKKPWWAFLAKEQD